MKGLRTLELGFPDTVRTYVSEKSAQRSLKKWLGMIRGVCNARIVPAGYGTLSPDSYPLRYTIILSCFSEESDIFLLARAGCPYLMHR